MGTQTVFYLHGALHLFDAGAELQKYTWINTGVPLIEQIRAALDRDTFPLFVAEGDSESKLSHIRHSAYLSRGERSLLSIKGALFVYGLSFADNDEHILRCVLKNGVDCLFVSLFGDSSGDENADIRKRVAALQKEREDRHPLEVNYFDADSAKVWSE